ncbi:hypothetical protein GPX89_17330 [Nocardia sp. ET3-3]|uniref:Lipoprotein n=1 Tax=Nocardia terrae TaxID=2675851 RepID=A0A7K1UXH6_9NOCA|nr:hypothetical protein [Nocardia terrae]MVU79002.1 hypothetical protein [Nocardia terrae]
MKRVIGTILAISSVTAGLTAVACSSTIDGQGVANEADVTAYRSSVASVSSSAAAAHAASDQGAVCGAFLAGALDANFKIDAVAQKADQNASRDEALPAINDAATALDTAGKNVSDALVGTSLPADFKSTLTEYSRAATAFGTQMTKLGQGTSNHDDFTSAQDRYVAAKNAALDSCS